MDPKFVKSLFIVACICLVLGMMLGFMAAANAAEDNFYLEAGFGVSNAADPSLDDTGTSVVGNFGFDVNKWLALEIFADYLGNFNGANIDAIGISGIGKLPLTRKGTVELTLGTALRTRTVDALGTEFGHHTQVVGIGYAYNIIDRLDITADVKRYFRVDANTTHDESDIDSANIGLRVRF